MSTPAPEAAQVRRQRMVAAGLFVLLVPALTHLAFSPLGFNPTDDGFILAYARRVLEGEVPHRDFISVRPAGSALLHAPVVALGGDHAFLLSRYVALVEMAVVALAWVVVLRRLSGLRLPPVQEAGLALVAFALNLHTFPLMAWHTLDGLLFLGVGLALALDPRRGPKLAGYALLGAAALFKQNFLLALPAALVLLGDWRRPLAWVAGLAPGAAYGAALLALGALDEGLLQTRSLAGELFRVGAAPYLLTSAVPWGLLLALAALALAAGRGAPFRAPLSDRAQRLAGVALLLLLVAGATALLPTARFPLVAAFALFGATVGAAAWAYALGRRRLAVLALLAALAAWSASLSFGYNTPALGAGTLAVVLLGCLLVALGDLPARKVRGPAGLALGAVVLLVVAAFAFGRATHVYREPGMDGLTRPLDGVLPGGAGLRASEGTHAFLADLRVAIDQAGPGPYAILPDAPGWWAKAPQRNPLPIDWPLDLELNKPELVRQVTGSLDAQRGNLTVLVQKVRAQDLAQGEHALGPGENQVVDHVRGSWTKVGETRLFDLYR